MHGKLRIHVLWATVAKETSVVRYGICICRPKISRRFHFFVLELPYMQPKGRTMRTTVRTVRAYEYGRSFGDSRRRKQEIIRV